MINRDNPSKIGFGAWGIRKLLLVLFALLFTISTVVLLTAFLNRDKNNVNKKYYSSKQECEEETLQGCACMLTNIDSKDSNPLCLDWQPTIN